MNELLSTLRNFDPVTLEEMDRVSLLNRLDTKFVFRFDQLAGILENIRCHYRVLEVKGLRINKYETIYFDTPDFQLYHKHLFGHVNRNKIRFRNYIDSEMSFFEIKLKNNKGRTIKSRLKRSISGVFMDNETVTMLKEKTSYLPEQVHPVLWNNFSRITFVNKTIPEKLTIDVCLEFKSTENSLNLPQLVIAELKQIKPDHASFFTNYMKQKQIRQNSLSKYCLGISILSKNIRRNNFKQNLVSLKKLCYDNTSILV